MCQSEAQAKTEIVGLIDVVILGAGISGLVAASELLKGADKRMLLIDNYPKLGGNHIDVGIGPYTFDVGSLIFQDDSPLLKHFPELLPLYIPIDATWSRLNPQGRVTAYPISIKDDVLRPGPIEWVRMLTSIAFARVFHRRLRNAYDFARFWMGARLLRRSGLERYMARFFGASPRRVELKFAQKRMLWIKEHASFSSPIFRRKSRRPATPPNRQLARPREGFDVLYQPAREKLEKMGARFILGAEVSAISKIDDMLVVRTAAGEFRTKRLISTFPITMTRALCGWTTPTHLRSVTLLSLFYSFKGDRGFVSSVLYNFSYDASWKRLTVYSDFYGMSNGREFFAVEVIADFVGGAVRLADRDFRNHTRQNKLLNGDLQLEGSFTLANAYPLYLDGADALAGSAIRELADFGIESIGRQGRFDYQPTARDTTLKAERAVRGIYE